MSFSRSFFKLSFSLIVLLAVWACSQRLYVPTATVVQDTSQLDNLTQGRKLYIQYCGSCHNLYRPETYTAAQWSRQVTEMKEKAKVSDEKAEMIYQYLAYASDVGQ